MRRNRKRKWMMRIGMIAAVFALILVFLLLFRVRKVNVYGNSRYDDEEISGNLIHNFLTGNSLYLQWEYRDGASPENMPYLDSLNVKMRSPFEIDVTVEEKELVGYVEQASLWYFDEEGILLENTEETYEGIPVVTGAQVGEPVLYQKLPTQSSSTLRTILSITHLLRQQELAAQEIRFDENNEITVVINGIEAKLGQDEYMEEKIANLRAILERTQGQTGILHMESFTGKNDSATFRITGEFETETETEDSGSSDTAEEENSWENASEDQGGTSEIQDSQQEEAADGENQEEEAEQSSSVIIDMVFNSSGTLVYNVHVENGTVVDSNGTAVSGCYVDESGYIVDAYMNRFDPQTGALVQ